MRGQVRLAIEQRRDEPAGDHEQQADAEAVDVGRLRHEAEREARGRTLPEDIADEIEHLSLAQVYAALARAISPRLASVM